MAAAESRVKKSLLNARVNLVFYFLTLVLSFFSRKIFLDCLGADFVGLTGTLQNLLGFLNLAELGISGAIGYVLYKPLFDRDEQKINDIISVFGYMYRWIGRIILGAGCILACFLPLIFPNTEFRMDVIFFAYFSFLASSLIGYFVNYKQTLLAADQKNYVVTVYYQSCAIVKTLLQLALAYYTGNYYLWIIIEVVFGVVYAVVLNWRINKIYPWLKTNLALGRQGLQRYPEVMKYTKQLFMHKIGAFAQWQTLPFFFYLFSNLQMVACIGNYTLIIDKLSLLVTNFLGGIDAGIGNLIAEGNKTKIIKTYWELFYVRFLIAGIMIFSVYTFINPFIALWVGSEYLLSNYILVLLCVNMLINQTNGTTGQFMYGYGLFSDTWVPISQFLSSIALSVLFGYIWGVEGVLTGNICSLFFHIYVWKPYFLFKRCFGISIRHYIGHIVKVTVLLALPAVVISQFVPALIDSYKQWLLSAAMLVGSYTLVSLLLMYVFAAPFRYFVKRFTPNLR